MDNDKKIEGLTSQQVKEQIQKGLVNTTLTKTSKSYAQIFFKNIFTWFNLICFFIAGVLISIGSFENVTFIVVFLANLCIGIIQEIRAKKMVDKISVINSAKVDVLRDGQYTSIDIDKVVLGDVVTLKLGEQVCADLVVLDGSVEVNESLLTGESKPIKKIAGDTLLGGSYVVSGECVARAEKVGLSTYSSSLIKKARQLKAPQSDILKTLNFIIKVIGILLLPLGIFTFLDTYSSGNVYQAIKVTSGSVIGMMPAGMFLLTSVALVVGVLNLARKKTLVQDLYSIETLARVNVLCLDKTGTLTDGTMSVKNIIPLGVTSEKVFEIMQSYAKATKTQNSTAIAIDNYFWAEDAKITPAVDVMEFNSEKKFSAVNLGELGVYMLGAPEFVSTSIDNETSQTIKALAQEGYRVLLLCKSNEKNVGEDMSRQNTPLSIIVIEDNIRPDAKSTIEWFNSNDVDIKIISGDNVDTVSNISRKVGVKNYDKCISLENVSNEELEKIAKEYTVFGRVTPEQKSIIVKALKAQGNKVAMTGDGVNDILALKEADCSIAMASGSEATRSASNLIMLENNFSAMPSIVAEGRRVINNISKASALFLTKTFFAMFLTIFALISVKYSYPLQPNQIFIWENAFIGIPAFFLSLQASKERIKGSFLSSLSSKSLPAALVLFLASMACYIFCAITGQPEMVPTLISLTVTFGAFFVLLNLCLPLDKYRSAVVFSMLIFAVLILAVIPSTFFKYLTLGTREVIFLGITLFCIYLAYTGLRLLFEKIFYYAQQSRKTKQPSK